MWQSYQAENVVRACIAQAMTKGQGAQSYAECMRESWGYGPEDVLKAAVTPNNTTDSSPLVPQSQLEFVNLVTPRSLLGRAGFQPGVVNVNLVDCTDTGAAYWVPENGLKPPTALQFVTRGRIAPHKVEGMAVVTDELVRRGGSAGELFIRNALTNACALAIDQALCDPTNAGGNDKPPSIAYGAPTVPSSGNFATDLQAAFALLAHPANAVIAANPQDAVRLAGMATPNGAPIFPEVGPRGGVIWGAPLYTSDGMPPGTVLVFDPSQIYVVNDGPRIDYASEALVDMGDGDIKYLWQTNLHGWRVEMFPSWLPPPAGAVAVIAGFSTTSAPSLTTLK